MCYDLFFIKCVEMYENAFATAIAKRKNDDNKMIGTHKTQILNKCVNLRETMFRTYSLILSRL